MCLNTKTDIDTGGNMNKKILIISILAAVLMIMLPLSSVVGTNVVKSNTKEGNISSPLFAVRSQRSVYKVYSMKIDTCYVGKGNMLNLFLSRQSSFEQMLNRAIKLIEIKPEILNVIVDRFETNPNMVEILSKNDISMDEVRHQLGLIKNDPSLLRQSIDESAISLSRGDIPQPLGLSTSSAIGCFIMLIALIPLALVLTMLIATITIVTCFNIGGCFEAMFETIMTNMIQGLTQPDA